LSDLQRDRFVMDNRNLVEASRLNLPKRRGAYYGGDWHEPRGGRYSVTLSPGTGESLGEVAACCPEDVDAAVQAARVAFKPWRDTPPMERAKLLRRVASIIRDHDQELAMIDAADCGNPFSAMITDVEIAAAQHDYFAGLVTEMKGASIPMGPEVVNFSVREPLGIVAKILPFNHPFMFCAGKIAAPLAAGNTVVVKPPEQAPLSSLRFAELIDGVLPPGLFNLLPGGAETGGALVSHRHVAMASVIGGVNTGRAVMRTAADRVKPVKLELGGKNALIAFPDADPDQVAAGIIAGMNFTWCGQSCGSTSRAFLHRVIHQLVLDRLMVLLSDLRPGLPTDPSTRMGAIISRQQRDRIMRLIESAKSEGATLIIGGDIPADPLLRNGFYIQPTVFAGVTGEMRIAREEIFGPVLAVLEWANEAAMLAEVNAVEYGLTCSIWTNDLKTAHRAAAAVEVGYVWINEASTHFLGAPFGGTKQSGFGREECLDELISYTQEKNIHVRFARP
jgi:betaine-aldehyde dehydrogenase